MTSFRALRLLGLVLFLIALAPGMSNADPAPGPQYFDYQVKLPPPPSDAVEAVRSLGDREQAVLSTVACGEELGFAGDSVAHEAAEGSTAQVLAKIEWGAGHIGQMNAPIDGFCRFSVTLRWADFSNAPICTLLKDANSCTDPDQPTQDVKTGVVADTIWPELLVGKLDTLKVKILDTIIPSINPSTGKTCSAGFPPHGGDAFADQSIVAWRRLDPFLDPFSDPAHMPPDPTLPPKNGAIQIDFAVSQDCLLRQAAQALSAFVIPVQKGQQEKAGTNTNPCHLFGAIFGDWDMAERNLIRIAYLIKNNGLDGKGQILYDANLNLRNNLLTLDRGPEGDSHNILLDCGNSSGHHGSAEDRATDRTDTGKQRNSDLGDFSWFLLMLALLLAAAAVAIALGGLLGGLLDGVIAGGTVVVVVVVLAVLNISETENHLLGINTTKYLNNQLIIQDLGNDITFTGPYIKDQIALKKWLLNRMQQYLQKDFIEYNARPYQRQSIESIRNIFDFAGDPGRPEMPDTDLRNAAHLVLDYTSAKFAVGNSQSRRIPPYRRHRSDFAEAVDANASSWNGLLDLAGSADHQVGLGLLYAGQTQQLPLGQASRNFSAEVTNAATSSYVPEDIILDLAIVKNVPIYQRIHHATEEIYSGGEGFLISAGGLATGHPYPVTGIDAIDGAIAGTNDYGSGVPTTLFLNAPTGPDIGFLGDPSLPNDDQTTKDQHTIFAYQQGLAGPGRAPPLSTKTFRDSSVNGVYARYIDEMLPGAALRSTIGELIRIKGKYHVDFDNSQTPTQVEPTYDNNICVWDGFACGTNIELGPLAANCSPVTSPLWTFIDTKNCRVRNTSPGGLSTAPRTFIALFKKDCPTDQKCTNYGFFEVIDTGRYANIWNEAPDDDSLFGKFVDQIVTDNAGLATLQAGPNILADYHSARRQKIEFSCWGHEMGDDYWGIFQVDNIPTHKLGEWPFAGGEWSASGSPLRAEVQTPMTATGDGVMEITSPRLRAESDSTKPRVLKLDFSDRDHPRAPAEN